MIKTLILGIAIAGAVVTGRVPADQAAPEPAPEPAPRRLAGAAVRLATDMMTVSSVRELRDGRLLVSDAKRPAVFIVDPASGKATMLGTVGGDSTQYAEPGGFYAGMADTTYLLDRSLARFLVLSPTTAIVASRSIKQRGVSSSTSGDIDYQRLDTRGLAYFTQLGRPALARGSGRFTDSVVLLRFDAVRQRADTVARLRRREEQVTQVDEHVTTGQAVLGSPEDDWGVLSDGRVAVVRAAPYQIEWHRPDGHIVRGPEIPTDTIRFTNAERVAIATSAAAKGRGGVTAGMAGDPSSTVSSSASKTLFASEKAPFDQHATVVAPDGHVWVKRTRPAGSNTALYDIFDTSGERVDRVELGADSRVIGFGKGAAYAVEHDPNGAVVLRKYKL